MFQIVKDGEKYANYDPEKEARNAYKKLTKWYKDSTLQVFHKTTPTAPSKVPIVGSSGYRKDVFQGWKKLESSTIKGDGFIITFEMYGAPDKDVMCDALNGWYTHWTECRIKLKDEKGEASITTSIENADKIFEILINITPIDDPWDKMSLAECVRAGFCALVNYLK